ncbi:MAG: UbiX family flavin prenyltransferase [Clostridiaceae bacterium]|nr:UbiX family flavin prenyltransferase [Clostridiaceae bacterium]
MDVVKKRIIVGITGASGIEVAIEILQILKDNDEFESHLVISDSAKETIRHECNYDEEQIQSLADVTYDVHHIGGAIASGTFPCEGMIVVPCSMKTVAGIACGYSDNLLLRAADVMIKERKKLVLMVRESPLSPIHLENLTKLAKIGVDIMPLVMTFYHRPQTIEDMISQMAARVLHQFGVVSSGFFRWGEAEQS